MRRSSPSPFLFALLAFAPLACAGTDSTDTSDVGSGDDALSVCPKHDTVRGIDISHWQYSIDWHKVRGAGYRFAFAKAAQGTDFIDPYFSRNWPRMKEAGLIRGAYDWIVEGNGAAQADFFLHQVKFEKGDLPPVIDVEAPGVKAEMVAAWVARVKEKTGRTPIIYTAGWTWNSKHDTQPLTKNPLWVADYADDCPVMPSHWKTWSFWQFPGPMVPGIGNRPDHDVFNGTLAELEAFAGQGSSTPDEGVGATAHTVAVARNLQNHPEVFAVADDGSLHHRGRTSNGWGPWHTLGEAGGGFNAAPTAANDADGRMEVAAVGHDGGLWLAFESAQGAWSSFYRLGEEGGGFVGHATMLREDDGRLHVFARAKDDSLWHVAQKTPGGAWTKPGSLGAPASGTSTAPGVAVDGDGVLHAVACGLNGSLYETHEATGGTWSAFAKLGKPGTGCASSPAVHVGTDGRLEVFADADDGTLWHARQLSVGGGWHPLGNIGAPHGVPVWHPVAITNPNGEAEIFLRGDDGSAWHVWRGDDGFSNFHRFAGDAKLVGTPAAMVQADGAMEVLYRGADDAVWEVREASGGTWKPETSLGKP